MYLMEFETANAVYWRLTIMWPLKRSVIDIALIIIIIIIIIITKFNFYSIIK
jgi:hypothetical protein